MWTYPHQVLCWFTLIWCFVIQTFPSLEFIHWFLRTSYNIILCSRYVKEFNLDFLKNYLRKFSRDIFRISCQQILSSFFPKKLPFLLEFIHWLFSRFSQDFLQKCPFLNNFMYNSYFLQKLLTNKKYEFTDFNEIVATLSLQISFTLLLSIFSPSEIIPETTPKILSKKFLHRM